MIAIFKAKCDWTKSHQESCQWIAYGKPYAKDKIWLNISGMPWRQQEVDSRHLQMHSPTDYNIISWSFCSLFLSQSPNILNMCFNGNNEHSQLQWISCLNFNQNQTLPQKRTCFQTGMLEFRKDPISSSIKHIRNKWENITTLIIIFCTHEAKSILTVQDVSYIAGLERAMNIKI